MSSELVVGLVMSPAGVGVRLEQSVVIWFTFLKGLHMGIL